MVQKIALVTGGYSGEAVISYKSAETIKNNLDATLWECYVIDIQKAGWFYINSNGEKTEVDKNDFSVIEKGEKILFEAILIGLHGTPGEDGKLQGYFDCLNIPYTTCNAATSALTFNKSNTVAVAAFAGIKVAKSILLFKKDAVDEADILQKLTLPVFVKPNNGGSSIGMSKVNNEKELGAALLKAFAEDEQVLVEEFIAGREFTIGVFKQNGVVVPLPITEVITGNEFFDFEAKYKGKSKEVTPAIITEEQKNSIESAAKNIYTTFNCNGIIRVDFILNKTDNLPYMLEINTVPGQSQASIVPQQVAAMGSTLNQFYTVLLNECLAQ